MKYQYTCCIVCMLLSVCVFAQAPHTLWTRTYGGAENDVASSIQQTSDGGYIVAGYTESFGAGEMDVWILRLDSLGDTLRTKTYGEAGWDFAASIQHTRYSGFIVVGTKAFYAVDGVWLLKIDDYGDTLWTKNVYPDSIGHPVGSDVKQTNDGGYVIAGNTEGASGSHHCSLIKTDSLGDTLWTNYHSWRYGETVWETSDSNYVIAGGTAGGYRDSDILMKVDTLGDLLWEKGFISGCGSHNHDVLETSDGCLTVCGSHYIYGIYLIRTDANGDTLWTKFFFEGDAHSLDRTIDGGYIMAGETLEDAVCIKTDSLGDTLWTAVYGGPGYDCLYSVLQTSDGGYIAVGETSSFGAGNADVWIIKLGAGVGVEENKNIVFDNENRTTTIFRGPLQLPNDKKCRIFDITGRVVETNKIQPGIYFIEVDGVVTQKVVKVR